MTKTKLIKKIIIETFYFIKAYFTSYLFPILKDVFEDTRNNFTQHIEDMKNYFIETLWTRLKKDIKEHLEMAIEEIDVYFKSASYEMKEKIIIDYIFEHIHLPWILKPTKPVVKKILKKKIREIIPKNLKKLNIVI